MRQATCLRIPAKDERRKITPATPETAVNHVLRGCVAVSANERWPARPPSEAPTKKLSTDSTSDASPDTAVLLSRIERILDQFRRILAPLAAS